MLALRGGAGSLRRGLASASSARQASLLFARGYSKASAPPPTPPAGQAAAATPPAPAPQPGMGVLGVIGMATVAGLVGYNGYYYVFADKAERNAMDAKVQEVEILISDFLYGNKSAKDVGANVVKEKSIALPVAPEARVPPEEPKAVEKVVQVVEEAGTEAGDEKLEEEAVAELEETAAAQKQEAAVQDKAEEKVEEKAPAKAEAVVEKAAAPTAPVATKSKSSVQVIADHAAEELSHYQERAKAIRVDTLNRAAEEALAEGNALAKHLESSLLKDLNKLDADALKLRIIQLTGEMQERTKWEALRLHETVRKAEEELSAKYTSLVEQMHKDNLDSLGRQARALETEKELALTQLAEAKEAELRKRFEEDMANFKKAAVTQFQEQRSAELKKLEAKLRADLEDRFWQHEAKTKEETLARIKELEDLKVVVEALEKAVVDERGYEAHSYKVHKVTAALLALEQKLGTSDPLFKELQALKKVTEGDEVIPGGVVIAPLLRRKRRAHRLGATS